MNTLKNITSIKTIVLAMLFAVPFVAVAQEEMEEPSFSISGTADVYFRQNLNLDNNAGGAPVAPVSSFANLGGFSLGMANIIGAYEGKSSGVVVDLVFGPRGSDAVFGSPLYSSTGQVINQLYAYWNASESVTFTIGNFNTFLGYEVISPTANFNYSTSYMFSYGPFSHTGLKADFDLGGGASGMLAVLNPTDVTEYNPTDDILFGAQLGYGGAYLNFLAGEGYTQIDLTAGWDVSDSYYFGINATDASYGTDDGFYGVALYNQFSVSDAFALGVRVEYFNDKQGGILGHTGEVNALDITLSANITVDNLTFIPEIRIDSGSEEIFSDMSGPSKSLSSFILAATYGF